MKQLKQVKPYKQQLPEGWRQITRETGLIEWLCPHGIGHPAPREHQLGSRRMEEWGVHTCDGCCSIYKW